MSTILLPVLQTKRFKDAPQAAAYLGLIPIATESGSSIKKPSRYNPDVKALYEHLLDKGNSKMCAIGAAMRKLVHICLGVLKHQTPYCPQTA